MIKVPFWLHPKSYKLSKGTYSYTKAKIEYEVNPGFERKIALLDLELDYNRIDKKEHEKQKLLLDYEIKDTQGKLLPFTYNETIRELCDNITIEFEILITVYLEMIFGWHKLLYLSENDDTNFKLDLTKGARQPLFSFVQYKYALEANWYSKSF